ncbi:MAG: hypothetical protein HQL15_07895 [Candidatus Omnitrophica bacterium]|nr:hypothetical protein [Candidatus Omnitrophota bacterium]
MGIKGIHIVLILVSVLLALVFGFWGVTHDFRGLGYFSFATSVALIIYGILFIRKAKVL